MLVPELLLPTEFGEAHLDTFLKEIFFQARSKSRGKLATWSP